MFEAVLIPVKLTLVKGLKHDNCHVPIILKRFLVLKDFTIFIILLKQDQTLGI